MREIKLSHLSCQVHEEVLRLLLAASQQLPVPSLALYLKDTIERSKRSRRSISFGALLCTLSLSKLQLITIQLRLMMAKCVPGKEDFPRANKHPCKDD